MVLQTRRQVWQGSLNVNQYLVVAYNQPRLRAYIVFCEELIALLFYSFLNASYEKEKRVSDSLSQCSGH